MELGSIMVSAIVLFGGSSVIFVGGSWLIYKIRKKN